MYKNITTINIMDKVLDESYWKPEHSTTVFSGHMHRNSSYETANSCGNCNGAYCDTCKEIIIPSHLEFSIGTDTLCTILIGKGMPEDIAEMIAYADGCSSYKGYHLEWPSEYSLKKNHSEFYNSIINIDEEIMTVINSFKGEFKCFSELRDTVKKHYNLGEYDFNGHVCNQLEMYWLRCNCKHEIAC